MLQKGAGSRPRVTLQGCSAQVGGEVGAGEEGDALLEGREGQSLGLLLAGRPLERHNQAPRVKGLGRPPHATATQTRGHPLTAEGPVAGSPSVMLGRDGDVYRGSGPTEPSRVTSLCARLVWGQSTQGHHTGSALPSLGDTRQGKRPQKTLCGRPCPVLRSPVQKSINEDSTGANTAFKAGHKHCSLIHNSSLSCFVLIQFTHRCKLSE